MEVRKERLFSPFFANALEVRGVSPSYAGCVLWGNARSIDLAEGGNERSPLCA